MYKSEIQVVNVFKPKPRQYQPVNIWHIALSQSCNLRCEYCVTGWGGLGEKMIIMDDLVQKNMVDFICQHMPESGMTTLDFGIGETLFKFDVFQACYYALEEAAKEKNIKFQYHVGTNGVALDDKKLQWLADHNIGLTFSIDGPADIHDKYRVDENGEGTFERAFSNWQKYRQLSKNHPNHPKCNVQSVYTDYSNLKRVNDFWLSNGLDMYDIIVEEPSEFMDNGDKQKWKLRRSQFLSDMQEIADDLAGELNVPSFLSSFRGPKMLQKAWVDIFLERDAGACGVGEKIMGIDANGLVYPCDGFVGQPSWAIGNVASGYYEEKRENFVSTVENLRTACNSCDSQKLCDGGCVATKVDQKLKLNKPRACGFVSDISKIAISSFEKLSA